MQIIFHIDLNAFFASAEVSVDPSLEGKPLVISGNSRRAIVSTASYEARAFGITSAMPLYQAKELCPQVIVRPSNFQLYKKLSNQFFDIIGQYSTQVEIASIDECYSDMTDYIVSTKIHPQTLAHIIQDEVLATLKLKCSIGIAPNKFMAKMASDMKKPMGITMLTKSNYKELLWPLPVDDMFGVGKKTAPKLKEAGIQTIGDIAKNKNLDILKSICGSHAIVLYQKANAVDFSKIHSEERIAKSIGNSHTLQYDTNDEDQLHELLKKLCKSVCQRAVEKRMVSNSIGITIKYTRFESVSRQTVLDRYINDYETIISTAKYLFDRHHDGRPVRLLGVTLNNVKQMDELNIQMSLFDQQNPTKQTTQNLIKQLNNDNDLQLMSAASLLKKNHKS